LAESKSYYNAKKILPFCQINITFLHLI